MKILITGGTGFIGTHVAANLISKGHDVVLFDRHRSGFDHGDIELIVGDVKDREAITEAIQDSDAVIHLAAILGTQETIETADFVAQTNIVGSLNVFDACKNYGKKAVYIAVGNHFMNNPYAITKSAAERFAFMYNKAFGTQIAVVRGLNAYGPGQKVGPVRKVVPNFVMPALSNEDITVFGSGNQIMDMIYVEDIAEVLVRALLMNHEVYDQVIEAGMGGDLTINELAEVVIKVSGSSSKINRVTMRAGEVPDSVVKADITTLEPLGYLPDQMTPLEDGIRKTVQWYDNNR